MVAIPSIIPFVLYVALLEIKTFLVCVAAGGGEMYVMYVRAKVALLS